jgi:hypothetical protein
MASRISRRPWPSAQQKSPEQASSSRSPCRFQKYIPSARTRSCGSFLKLRFGVKGSQ